MSDVVTVILLTTLAGAAMPIGGAIAQIESIRPKWLEREFRHGVIAFGGGVLLSAVALVLVPHGVAALPLISIVFAFSIGGIAFMGLDVLLDRMKNSASQLVAMLSDFIPEAMAMGAGFATGDSVGVILALMIALQNLPEGFNAYRELMASGQLSSRAVLLSFMALVPLGPLSGLVGYYWLAHYPEAVGFIMLLAAGGILYLTFQDVAPQAKLNKHWLPALAAVFGFLLGLVGNVVVG